MGGQNASNAILAQGSQCRALVLTHPPAPSGLRWPPAKPGRAGGQRSWSTCEREAVIRVLFGSYAQGTGLSNSQASVVPWIRASPLQAWVWGGQPWKPWPVAAAAVSPRGGAGSALSCSRET